MMYSAERDAVIGVGWIGAPCIVGGFAAKVLCEKDAQTARRFGEKCDEEGGWDRWEGIVVR